MSLQQAPTVGRTPKIVTVGGREFRINPLPPRQALRVSFRVIKQLGDPIASLLSGAGLALPGMTDAEGHPLRVTLGDLGSSELARQAVVPHLLARLTDMSADDLDDLLVDLIVGFVDVRMGATWAPIVSSEQLNVEVSDQWELLGLARHAFEHSMRPTSADDGTRPAASATTTGT